MCLANVYKGQEAPENLVLGNVQRIDIQNGQVFLTDLMDRQVVIEGELVSVDLVGNVAIVRETVALRWRNTRSCARCRTSAQITRWRDVFLRRDRNGRSRRMDSPRGQGKRGQPDRRPQGGRVHDHLCRKCRREPEIPVHAGLNPAAF